MKRSKGRQRDKTAHVHMGLGGLMCNGGTEIKLGAPTGLKLTSFDLQAAAS